MKVGDKFTWIPSEFMTDKARYGNGMTRRNNLAKAGYDYNRIQGLVNKILRGEVK